MLWRILYLFSAWLNVLTQAVEGNGDKFLHGPSLNSAMTSQVQSLQVKLNNNKHKSSSILEVLLRLSHPTTYIKIASVKTTC